MSERDVSSKLKDTHALVSSPLRLSSLDSVGANVAIADAMRQVGDVIS